MHNTDKSMLDDGQPLVEVIGFAPLQPAEFVRYQGAVLQSNVGILPLSRVRRK